MGDPYSQPADINLVGERASYVCVAIEKTTAYAPRPVVVCWEKSIVHIWPRKRVQLLGHC
jgi:hypothetical protein